MDINKKFFAVMCCVAEDRLEWCIINETDFSKAEENRENFFQGLLVKGTNLIFNIETGEFCQEEGGSFCRTFVRGEKIEDENYPNCLTIKAFYENGQGYIQLSKPEEAIVNLYTKRWGPLNCY